MASPRRSRRVSILLLALLIPICILSLVYSWLAFAPTGYSDFEREAAASIERLEKAQPIPRAASTPPTAPPVVFPPVDTSAALPDPVHNPSLALSEFGNWLARSHTAFVSSPPGTSDVFTLYAKADEPWPELVQDMQAHIAGVEQSLIPFVRADGERWMKIDQTLDAVRSMLRSRDPRLMMELNEGGRAWIVGLAIGREDLRAGSDSALLLLQNYLELVATTHKAAYPDGIDLAPTVGVVGFLGTLPDFPLDTATDLAREKLEEARLDRQIADDLRAAWLVEWRQEVERRLEPDALVPLTNAVHFFAGGKVEMIWQRAMLPVVRRRFDDLVSRWARGEAVHPQGTYVHCVHMLLNAQGFQPTEEDLRTQNRLLGGRFRTEGGFEGWTPHIGVQVPLNAAIDDAVEELARLSATDSNVTPHPDARQVSLDAFRLTDLSTIAAARASIAKIPVTTHAARTAWVVDPRDNPSMRRNAPSGVHFRITVWTPIYPAGLADLIKRLRGPAADDNRSTAKFPIPPSGSEPASKKNFPTNRPPRRLV